MHRESLDGTNSLRKWDNNSRIPYAGRVFDSGEVKAAVSSSLDFWLTLGVEGNQFEKLLAGKLGITSSKLVNSGSSANLIALNVLTSSSIKERKRITRGDEIITVACGFPTTVAPIIQIGAKPIFLDVDPETGNINTERLEEFYRPGKTKAVVLAHALGNPFDISKVLSFCKKYDIWLIEDNCDSLGSKYTMPEEQANKLGIYENSPDIEKVEGEITRYTGTWGDISTQSFYPPHHITTGEGGAINVVSDKRLIKIVESFRDWGRACWCPSGMDNSCGKRYGWKLGDLPLGYDHKYMYTHLGYNLKPLEIQAAIGIEQLKK